MEFFGIPVNDEILSNPRPEQVLVIGKKFVGSEVYDDLLSRFDKGNMNQKQTIKSFYEALAGLNIETQDECFEALVKELNEYKVYGFVVDRLKEGNDIKRSNNFNLSVKSNSRIVWFCFTSLCNWFIKQVPLFLIQPTLFKSKSNRNFIAYLSPGYEQFACSNFNKLRVIFSFDRRL